VKYIILPELTKIEVTGFSTEVLMISVNIILLSLSNETEFSDISFGFDK